VTTNVKRRRIVWFLFSLPLAALVALLVYRHYAEGPAPLPPFASPPGNRTVRFPERFSLGVLDVRDWDSTDDNAWKPLGIAAGRVKIPAGKALRLRYVEGLPSKQIAQQLGKTDGAVRVMLTRSINRLQAILDPGNQTLG